MLKRFSPQILSTPTANRNFRLRESDRRLANRSLVDKINHMLKIYAALLAISVLPDCLQAQNLTAPVGIGTTTPKFSLHILNSNTLGLGVQSSEALGANSGAFLRLYSSTLPTAANQRVGGLLMGTLPASGAALTGAQIETVSEATWTEGSAHPAALKFLTVPFGSTTVTERMRITADGNVGIGTGAPTTRLHVAVPQVVSPQTTIAAKFTQTNVPETSAYLNIVNATSSAGLYIPGIVARSYSPGKSFGLYVAGESEDIAPSDEEGNVAAVILDGRSKSSTRLVNNNVLAVNSGGQNLMIVKADGSVGINAIDTKGYKLAVGGSLIAERIKVKLKSSWPDYVFHPGYELPTLAELEKYVKENEHLPDIPTADEVENDGLDLGEMNKKLLQKIEELTLYLIDMKKEIDQLKKKMKN